MPLCCRRAVSLLAGALDAIRPSPKFDRQMKLLLSAVFLLAILTPLVQGSRDFSVDWSGDEVFSAELTETVAQETAACAAENLEMTLQQQLSAEQQKKAAEERARAALIAGISPDAKVQVQMHTAEDGRIEIDCVTAFCTEPEKARALLAESLGNEVKLYVEEDS